MDTNLEIKLKELKDLDSEILETGKYLTEPGEVWLYTIDYVIISILHRAISINTGFLFEKSIE